MAPTAGNINTIGTGSITVVGNPGTSTLTTELTGLTNNSVLYGLGTSTIGLITPVDNGVLITSAAGVPSLLADGTTGQVLTATTGSPATWANLPSGASLIGVTDTATPFLTALGSGAGTSVTGVDNTLVGFNAGTDITTSTNSCAFGYEALASMVSGLNSTAMGYKALNASVSGGGCAFGSSALAVYTGTFSTAIGTFAQEAVTTGSQNTSLGNSSLIALTTGASNVAIGYTAGNSYTGAESNNICIGTAVTGTVGESAFIRIGLQGTQTKCLIAGVNGATPSSNTPGVVLADTNGIHSTVAQGTSGQILTANGTTAAPTWKAPSASGAITTIDGDSGSMTPTAGVVTISGGTTGLTTTATASTMDLTGTLIVGNGGTGAATFTAYSVITAGTTSTGALQNVVGVGSTGNQLTSNGASALPTWQNSTVFTYTSVTHAESPYTLLGTDQYVACVTSGGAITIKLSASPTTGRVRYIKDTSGMAATNNITVTTTTGTVNIDGATSYVMATNYQAINVLFNGLAYEVF